MKKKQYDKAMAIVSKLIDKDPSTRSLEGKILRLLADLLVDYEKKLYPRENKKPPSRRSKKG